MSEQRDQFGETSRRMDRLYRWQRHIYDLTRPVFLAGRDRLLRGIELPPEGRLIEIGCGTGRNLVRIARAHPGAELWGLDASEQMLRTARRKRDRAGLAGRVHLRHGRAEEIAALAPGVLPARFDDGVASYVCSMLEHPMAAVLEILTLLARGGTLHIVDFGDFRGWPALARAAAGRCLGLFGVAYRPSLLEGLKALERAGRGRLELEWLAGRYAFLARFRT